MEQITHTDVLRLVHQLPKPFVEKFFAWRSGALIGSRLRYHSPEFIAECLQKAVALHAEVDRILAAWSGDKPKTDSQPTEESPDGTT